MSRKGLWLIPALVVVLGSGCEKKERRAITPAPASTASEAARGPNERFYTVQKRLDPGGSFYLYMDVKDLLRNTMNQIQPLVVDPQAPPEAAKFLAMANQAVDRLGLYGIHDVGVSTFPDGAVNRTKIFISAPEGRQKGLMALLGGEPHPFPLLDRIPQDSALFITGDYDAQAAWNLILQIVQDIGGLEGLSRMDQGLAKLREANGIDIPALIPTLAGEIAIVAAQDPGRKITLPMGEPPLTIDAPLFALMTRVKDDALYRSFKQMMMAEGIGAPETTEGKLRTIALRAPRQNPLGVAPVLATDGEWVYFASHQDYLKRLASGAGPSLRNAEEFKQLSAGLPAEGNALAFISQRLGAMLAQILQAADAGQRHPGPRPEAWFRKALTLKASPGGALTVRVNEPDGVFVVNRSSAGGAQIVASALAAPAVVMAAVAVPNFIEAGVRAKVSRAKADMRSMATGLEAYHVDCNSYLVSSADPALNVFGDAARRQPQLLGQPTFVRSNPAAGMGMMTLTTPIAYLTNYMNDPFAPGEGVTYCYYAARNGWILWSAGPDGKYDLTVENVAEAYDSKVTQPSLKLIVGYTYDPTNGTRSGGDVWRVKQ